MKTLKGIAWGFVLVIIGILFGLNSTGVIDFDLFFDGWWTLFIIIPSLIGIFTERDKTGNIIGVIVGVVLLLACQNVIKFSLIADLFFPALIILIGLSLIFKNTIKKNVSEKINTLNSENNGEEICATFSGQDIEFDNKEFNGTKLSAVFGGIKLDLSKSIFNKEAVINCSAIFGGIDIIVPSDVKVIIKSNSIFGGVSDERKYKPADSSKVLYINASCVFGGVEIK